MPASTTRSTAPKEKTYTIAQIVKAMQKTRTSILEDMAESSFLAPTDLACKLFIKRMKEELDK